MKKKAIKWNAGSVFVLALLMAAVCLLPFAIRDGGWLIYYGDYNAQQQIFYRLVHRAVREGNLFYSLMTDLGSSIYTSYSFYLLGSPFFWITVLFPEQAVPYLLPLLLILKLALASVSAFVYIRRLVADARAACIGGLLYGFCGFQIMNLVFNHFLDVTVFFPLYLIVMEDLIEKKKRGRFALFTAFMAVLNYYFFVGEVVFCILYVLVKYVIREQTYIWKEKLFLIGRTAVEGILGVLLSSFFLLPSLFAVSANERVGETVHGVGLLLYPDWQTYAALLKSIFLPPDLISRATIFATEQGAVASVSLYLPVFAVSGVIAAFAAKKGPVFLRRLCILCAVFAVIPVCNSLFSALNAAYYARWFYMPVLCMAALTAAAVAEFDKRAFSIGTGVCIGGYLMLLAADVLSLTVSGTLHDILEIRERALYRMELVMGGTGLLVLVYLVWILGKDKKGRYVGTMLALTAAGCVCMAVTHIYAGYSAVSDDGRKAYRMQVQEKPFGMLADEADGFYRVETDQTSANEAMVWGYPTVSSFLSTVSGSIQDFYQFAGITRGVSSRIPYDRIGIRSLLSVRYFLQNEISTEDRGFVSQELLFGYEKTGSDNGYGIYENTNCLKMGTVFTSCMTREEYGKLSEEEQDLALVHTLVVEDGQAVDASVKMLDAASLRAELTTDEASFAGACEKLNASAADIFSQDGGEFLLEWKAAQEGLLFLSIPYSEGFTAWVDGSEADIIRVDGGLMAVKLPANTKQVRLVYREPGLKTGIWISIAGVVLLLLYLGMTTDRGRAAHWKKEKGKHE